MANAAAARSIDKTDNLPPPLITRDQLVVDFAHLSDQIVEIEKEFVDAPTVIEDTEDLTVVTRLATTTIGLAKKVETARKGQVQPFLDAESTVNDYLKRELPGRLSSIKTKLEAVT